MQQLTELLCHDSGTDIAVELQTLMKTFCPGTSVALTTNLQGGRSLHVLTFAIEKRMSIRYLGKRPVVV